MVVASAGVAAMAASELFESLGREARRVRSAAPRLDLYSAFALRRPIMKERVAKAEGEGLVDGEEAVVHVPLPLQPIPAGVKRIA